MEHDSQKIGDLIAQTLPGLRSGATPTASTGNLKRRSSETTGSASPGNGESSSTGREPGGTGYATQCSGRKNVTLEADETSRVSGTPPTTGAGNRLAHQLFFKFGGVYGEAWTRQFRDEKALACAVTEWTEALMHFDFPTVKRAF